MERHLTKYNREKLKIKSQELGIKMPIYSTLFQFPNQKMNEQLKKEKNMYRKMAKTSQKHVKEEFGAYNYTLWIVVWCKV